MALRCFKMTLKRLKRAFKRTLKGTLKGSLKISKEIAVEVMQTAARLSPVHFSCDFHFFAPLSETYHLPTQQQPLLRQLGFQAPNQGPSTSEDKALEISLGHLPAAESSHCLLAGSRSSAPAFIFHFISSIYILYYIMLIVIIIIILFCFCIIYTVCLHPFPLEITGTSSARRLLGPDRPLPT